MCSCSFPAFYVVSPECTPALALHMHDFDFRGRKPRARIWKGTVVGQQKAGSLMCLVAQTDNSLQKEFGRLHGLLGPAKGSKKICVFLWLQGTSRVFTEVTIYLSVEVKPVSLEIKVNSIFISCGVFLWPIPLLFASIVTLWYDHFHRWNNLSWSNMTMPIFLFSIWIE